MAGSVLWRSRRNIGLRQPIHYRIAAGSAEEVRSQLAIAVAWGDIREGVAQPALELVDRILAMLWRLTEASDRGGVGR